MPQTTPYSGQHSQQQVCWYEISENEENQRLDNFLVKILKGVPKSRIYRALRSGEVRVNKSRKKQHYQLQIGDVVRIPPIRIAQKNEAAIPADKWKSQILTLFEDDDFLIVDKPSGLAVHGGSGLDYGLIEALRYWYPEYSFLELCHRLDRETSGILVLAKNRQALTSMNALFKNHSQIQKFYYALTKGELKCQQKIVNKALANSTQTSQKHIVVDRQGQEAISVISTEQIYADSTLVSIELVTGRTHQARVHMSSLSHPIAGDWTYGDRVYNKSLRKAGLNRLFLHAYKLVFIHPITNKSLTIQSALATELLNFLTNTAAEEA